MQEVSAGRARHGRTQKIIKTFAEITFRQGKGSEMKKFCFDASRAVRNFLNGVLALTTVLTLFAAPQVADAQTAPAGPVRENVDANGVDLFTGKLTVIGPAVVLGSEGNTLSYYRLNKGSGWTDNVVGFMNQSGTVMTVSLGGVSDSFWVSGSAYTSTEGNGSTLTYNSTSKIYTYTRGDGTVARFDKNKSTNTCPIATTA